MAKERIVSLYSGGGTTVEQMVIAQQTGKIHGAEIVAGIASNLDAGGTQKLLNLGIPVVLVDPERYRGDDRKIDLYGYGKHLSKVAHSFGATGFTQNGHLPLTPPVFIEDMEREGMGGFNQHPGRVPDFGGKGMYGRRVHAATLLFRRMTKRDMWTEVIAQRVHVEFDKGAVVGLARVPILKDDTVDDLQKRALPEEHGVQIKLMNDIGSHNINEIPMESVLKPGEEVLLEQAKRAAILLYPHG